jgi:DNA polymerase-3 subunit beta
MELKVGREELVQALYLTQGVVERRNTLPILANVLLQADDGTLAVTATDLEVGVRRRCPATVKKRGDVTVAARKLYEIAREIPDESLTIRSSGSGLVEIQGGRSRFRVVSLEAKDFPELPFGAGSASDGTKLRVTATLLAGMIDRTIFAVSSDETRFNLSGVLLELPGDGEIRMVATDGHRLAMVTRSVAGVASGPSVTLPRKGLQELRRLLESPAEEEVNLTLSPKELRLHSDSVEFFMRAIEGEFPDYRQVVPKEVTTRVKFARDVLMSAVRRVSLLASERSRGIKFQFEPGRLEISANSPDLGEASEEIEANYAGESLAVGFNGRYLLDVLGVHTEGEQIEIGLTTAVGPGVIRSEEDQDYCYVIMPMRL